MNCMNPARSEQCNSIPFRPFSSGMSEGSLQLSYRGDSLSSATLSSIKDDVSLDSTVNSELNKFEMDQAVLPNPVFNNRRRTMVVTRSSLNESFGFALQSYVFKRCATGSMERVTYVDYVRSGGPAAKAGVQRGDVLVAVNNMSVIGESHSHLVNLLSSQLTMRLVVLFQNISRVIQLSVRSLQLQYLLKEKEKMIEAIAKEEAKILKLKNDTCKTNEYEFEKESVLDQNESEERDALGVGFTHVIRVDSHNSLAGQITRL